MLYCENCRIVFGEGVCCPVCGNEDVREPLPEDFCFLIETEAVFADMLKTVLDDNNIPSFSPSTIGAALRVRGGAMFDRVRFYVRYDDLEAAKEIAASMFGAEGPSDQTE